MIRIKIIEYNSVEYKEAVMLSEEILRKPFGGIFLKEELEEEKDHIHIAGFKDTNLIARAVLVPIGDVCKMQRVAVKQELQGKGIGSLLMKFCEEEAIARGFKAIYCHARDSAVEFYKKHGYVEEGDYFYEDAITPAHLKMMKILRGKSEN